MAFDKLAPDGQRLQLHLYGYELHNVSRLQQLEGLGCDVDVLADDVGWLGLLSELSNLTRLSLVVNVDHSCTGVAAAAAAAAEPFSLPERLFQLPALQTLDLAAMPWDDGVEHIPAALSGLVSVP